MMQTDLSGFSRLELDRVDLDDGVVDLIQMKHSSADDSPTINDGIGIVWQLQDGTANSKLLYEGAALDIVATDIGSTSQDVDLNFYQRIAGTQTNTWSIDADGGFKINISPLVLTSADATTEFQINNTAVDGDPYLSWALSGVRQFSFGVDDGDSDKLKLGTTAIGTGTFLEVTTGGALVKVLTPTEIENPVAGGASALLIDNNDTDEIAVEIDAANIDADIINIIASAVTTARVIDIPGANALTTGVGLNIASGSSTLSSGELMRLALTSSADGLTAKTDKLTSITGSRLELRTAGATSDDFDVLEITRQSIMNGAGGTLNAAGSVLRLENIATQTAGTLNDTTTILELVQDVDSSGDVINIDANGTGQAISIVADNTTTNVVDISATTLTEGAVIDISDLDAITAGKAIHVDATGITQTTGVLVHIDSGSTALTGAGRLLLVDATGDFNDAAGIAAEIQTVHTTGTGFQLTMDAVTDGIGMFGTFDGLTVGEGVSLTHTTSVIADGGSLFRLSSTGVNTGGATNGTVFDLSATAQAAGTVAKITSSGTTTGDVFDITATNQTSGNLITLTGGGAGTLTGGSLARFDNSGATTGAILELINTTGVYTSTEGMLNIDADALTTGTVVDINAVGLTSGNGFIINGGGANMITGGALIRLDMGAAIAGSGLEIATSGVYTGTDGLIDISAAALTTGTAVDLGDLDGISTGKGVNIASGSEVIAAGELATIALTSSGSTITAKTGALVSIASSRTELAAAATADNYDVLSIIRTNITDTLGTLTADGSVARLENVATQTAGTLTDNVDVLEIVQDAQSTGQSITIDHNPNSIAVNIDAENTTTNVIDISADVLTQGKAIDLSDLDAITTGKAIHVDATGITQTDGILLHIDSASTALTATGRLLLVDHTGVTTAGQGAIAEVASLAADNTTIFKVTAGGALTTLGRAVDIDANLTTSGLGEVVSVNALTTGVGLYLLSSSDVITGSGRLFWLDHTGTTSTSGTLFEISSDVTDETTIALIKADGALVAGTALDISVAAMTAGTALDISNADALTTGFMANFTSDSADVSTRNLVHIHNDNVLAVGAVPLNIVNDAASNILELVDTDPAALGVVVERHHDSASPAVDDVISRTNYDGEDSASNQTTYAQSDVIIAVPTSGAEIGRQIHRVADLDGSLYETHRQEVGDLKPVRLNSQSYEWVEDFDDEASGVQFEAGLVADFWTTAGTNYNANNVTYTAGPNGEVQAVTAGSDDDSVTSMAVANWRIDQNPILEARFKVTDITNVWIAVGYVEGAFADKAAPDDDICVVGIDSDNGHGFGADQIVAVTNDNNAGAVYSDCGVAISADTYITIRIDCTDTEQPRVWVNNTGGQITAVNEVLAASITGTVQAAISVAPYFMVQSLSAAADTFTIDYIKTWQGRA